MLSNIDSLEDPAQHESHHHEDQHHPPRSDEHCQHLLRRLYVSHQASKPTQLTRAAVPFERLNKTDALLLVLDLQDGLYTIARDFDASLYYNAMLAHAALGKLFDLPVVLSTSAQTGPNGPLPKAILEM